MMKNVICIWVICLAVGCQSVDKIPQPDVLIAEDRMVEILTDIAFIKAAKSSSRRVLEKKNINPEAFIFKRYGIDSTIFAQNNAWYTANTEQYKAIFTKVKANLEKDRKHYKKLKKKEDSIKKVKDSIKKIQDSIKKIKDTLSKKDRLITSKIKSKAKKDD